MKNFTMLAGAGVVIIPLLFTAPPAIGLPERPLPDPALATLGEAFFHSTAASADGTISCASCHDPQRAFADARPVSRGVYGRMGTRNAPTLINARFNFPAMWDGRRSSVADQVLRPLTNRQEHGLATINQALHRFETDAQIMAALKTTSPQLDGQLTEGLVRDSLTAYVESLDRGNSNFDRFQYAGDVHALSREQRRGFELFQRFDCTACHTAGPRNALFTDDKFHATSEPLDAYGGLLSKLTREVAALPDDGARERAIAARPEVAALGRFVVSGKADDVGAFRTPSLRNVARTAPYFHDGSVPSLEAAVRREVVYRNSVEGRPAVIDSSEIDELVAFLDTLDSH